MPFNGAGVYVPPGADFPAVTQTVISSTHYNNVINDLATALSLTLTRDGQATATANIPFGGFRATNVGITGIAGSVGTPAINVSDSGTGLYRSAASELAVTVAGTQRARFDSTGLIVTGTVTVSTSVVTPLVNSAGSNLVFQIAGVARWQVDTGQPGLTPNNDNTDDLGRPALRVRSVFATTLDSGTTASLFLKTNNGGVGLRIDNIASAVVQYACIPEITGGKPRFVAVGEASVGAILGTAGTGDVDLVTSNTEVHLRLLRTASANRFVTITGSNGGNPTISTSAGSLAITPAVVMASTLQVSGSSIQVGTNPSASSGLNTPYGIALTTRNSANSGDLTVAQTVTVNGQTDVIRIGGGIFAVDGAKSVQLFARAHAGVPTTSDIPAGNWMLWDDTSAVTYKLYFNDGATLRSVALA